MSISEAVAANVSVAKKRWGFWTDARIEILKVEYAKGLSASQIAVAIGECTRNAVVGKIGRLGLNELGGIVRPKHEPEARKPRVSRMAVFVPKVLIETTKTPTADTVTSVLQATEATDLAQEIPTNRAVTLERLKEGDCRWPLGDPAKPGFKFCGNEKRNKATSYCAGHCRIAYLPPSAQRKPVNTYFGGRRR